VSLVLMLLLETVSLKEKASVAGRWIRVVDLVDAAAAVRLRLADVYLGRAPEEGQTRTITLDEIRRELERRGLDPAEFAWRGERVDVTVGDVVLADDRRASVAFALKRHLMEREGEQVSVRVLQLQPATWPDGVEIAEIKSRTLALLSNGTKVEIVARISRMRDAVVAARDLAPGRAIDRADLELKRIEVDESEQPVEMGGLIGAVPAVRIRQGAAVTAAELRLKSVVKKGDIVRAVSSGYEVDVRALEDGAPGQEIGVEFVSSRNRVRARVAGGSRVDVVEASR
jgi:flagella basal body P-ring formation protein FlgA